MKRVRRVGLAFTTLALAGSGLPAPSDGDPVTEARAQRAAALGIAESDLPPVPRTIVEPPPLPAPEIHPRDTHRGSRKQAKKGGRKRGGARTTKGGGKPARKRK